jgi:hypothetical protein
MSKLDTEGLSSILNRPLSRRGFTGGALAAGGGIALLSTGVGATLLSTVDASAASSSDLSIVNFALTAEYLAVDAYTQAIAAAQAGKLGSVPTNVADTMVSFLGEEKQHVEALQQAGGTATKPNFTYPAATFTSLANAADLALTLETAFVGAYITAVTKLQSTALQSAAGTIGANEGEHRVILRQLLNMTPFVDLAFEKPVSVAAATKAVDSFIAKS